MERMLQSAVYGVQLLEEAIIQPTASEIRTSSQIEDEDNSESTDVNSPSKKSVSGKHSKRR